MSRTQPARKMTMDPILLETVWTRLISTVDEAAAILLRTSFSTVVRDSYDFSVIVTDKQGRAIAQASDSLPSFIGTLPRTVKAFLREFPPESLRPGDVLITNDMYLGTGHIPDISLCRPIFRNGELLGFSASTAHSPDIGGKIRSPEPREIFEEGLQIPMLKLLSQGRINDDLMKIIRKNVRVPDLVEGDLWAQIAALQRIEKRVIELIGQYDLGDLDLISMEMRNRAEAAIRSGIRKIPNGDYRATLNTDGLLKDPLTLALTVTVRDDEIFMDFSGSSPQVGKAINCAMCYTYAMCAYALKCALAPEIPNNEGSTAPLHVSAPEGSVVNPRFPAAGGSRVLIGHYIPTLVFQALAEVVPDQVLAGAGSPIWCLNLSSVDEHHRPLANLFFFNGGMGASNRSDGLHCTSWPSNISSTPAELIEKTSPLRVLRRELRMDSGGQGRYRGGMGQEIVLSYVGQSSGAISFLAERTVFGAPGLFGGGNGKTGAIQINDRTVDPKAQHIINNGDTIRILTPGGGGYGKPKQ